jgi:hypothetical protein
VENNSLKLDNERLMMKNSLGLESLTPRPDYMAILRDRKVEKNLFAFEKRLSSGAKLTTH